jgi:hypothetical protein
MTEVAETKGRRKPCAFPGCTITLSRNNSMCVCRGHYHKKPYCRCTQCNPGDPTAGNTLFNTHPHAMPIDRPPPPKKEKPRINLLRDPFQPLTSEIIQRRTLI